METDGGSKCLSSFRNVTKVNLTSMLVSFVVKSPRGAGLMGELLLPSGSEGLASKSF